MINDWLPWTIRRASAEDIWYRKWAWPSIDSVDLSQCAFQVWCFSHIWFWSYSLSKVKFKHSYVQKILCIIRTPLHVASLGQLSASFRQHWKAQWPCCHMPDFHCHSCFGHWEALGGTVPNLTAMPTIPLYPTFYSVHCWVLCNNWSLPQLDLASLVPRPF